MDDIITKLLDKSKEAFTMAIELYNKPTIRYRSEGFSMFICNAWELMLKAHLLKTVGPNSIYYKDNPNRTITLENCVRLIFTNDKDPLRLNLERIIELRNTSTHFITEEYEMLYVPLFQACIFNFNDKILKFHDIDMTEIIPTNFLTLAVNMKALNEEEIIAKYPEEIATKLISVNETLNIQSSENNSSFSIRIDHYHYITKQKDTATSVVRIDNKAETGVKIIKELKDPNNTHKYNAKKCIIEINSKLRKNNIALLSDNTPVKFNMYHFTLFTKYFNIKENTKLCYTHKIQANPTYSYSIQAIDFIFDEIKKES